MGVGGGYFFALGDDSSSQYIKIDSATVHGNYERIYHVQGRWHTLCSSH